MKRGVFRVASLLAAAVVSASGLSACKGRPGSEIELSYVAIGGEGSATRTAEVLEGARELIRKIASSPWKLTRELVIFVDVNKLPAGEVFVGFGGEVKKSVHGGRREKVEFDRLLIRFDPSGGRRAVSVVPAAEGEPLDGQVVYLTDIPSSEVTAALESLDRGRAW